MAAAVVAAAADLGLEVARLPHASGLRFGIAAEATQVESVVDRLAQLGYVTRRCEKELANNLYEFDQVTAAAPEVATYYVVRPAAHCDRGLKYLERRAVTLEVLEPGEDLVVVPRPALGPRVYGRREFEQQLVDVRDPSPLRIDWPFPIDLVYTWVDSDDPVWQSQRAKLAGEEAPPSTDAPVAAVNAARWYSRDELKYSLRSIWMYAPWVRTIYIVTNGQVPPWLLDVGSSIRIVTHDELYDNPEDLPTFNSNHIETVLHRIPDLAEHFLYLNDDFFLASPTTPSDFFYPSGICRIFRTNRYIDERPVTEHDRATVAAHKNTRDALEQRTGVRESQKFKHAPYVMRRSVWYEIEEAFGDRLADTRHNKFRSFSDLNGQFLFCQYALIKGYGIPSRVNYTYLEVLDERFEERLASLDDPKYQAFCLNDSNSTDENVEQNEDLIARFFERRFPVLPPWEDGSPTYLVDGSYHEIDTGSTASLEREGRDLGPERLATRYRGLLARDPQNRVVAKKLLRLATYRRDIPDALYALSLAMRTDEDQRLARLDVLSKSGWSTDATAELVPTTHPRRLIRGLGYLGRTVTSSADFDRYLAVVNEVAADHRDSPQVLARIAAAARRSGDPRTGVSYLEKALARAAELPPVEKVHRRERERLNDPWVVVDDLHELAESVRAEIFADAGTLLGFVREGTFLGHDYDIDFSIRDVDKFKALRELLEQDWRFDVSRVRTPDTLIQARHVNGTLIDIFRYQRVGDTWLKSSHVYGWKFADFALSELRIAGRTILVPDPVVPHLEQMYGEDWQVPQPGFDSRLRAPNRVFTDLDEIVCTVLNKAVVAASERDEKLLESYLTFLRQEAQYDLPHDLPHMSIVAEG